jgi:hypothetical protein
MVRDHYKFLKEHKTTKSKIVKTKTQFEQNI